MTTCAGGAAGDVNVRHLLRHDVMTCAGSRAGAGAGRVAVAIDVLSFGVCATWRLRAAAAGGAKFLAKLDCNHTYCK